MQSIGENRKHEMQNLSRGMQVFGEYMKDLRKSKGITQVQMSDSLGYTSPQFISNYERGLCYPPPNSLRKITEFLEVNYFPVALNFKSCKVMDLEDLLGISKSEGA